MRGKRYKMVCVMDSLDQEFMKHGACAGEGRARKRVYCVVINVRV